MASAGQISCRNLGRQSGRRPLRKVYRSPGHRPLRVRHRRCAATPGGAGRSPPPTGTAEVLPGGAEAIPQSPVGRQLPLHKGAFSYGGRGVGGRTGPPLRSVGGGGTDGAFHASLAAERGAASVPCFRFVTVCFRFVGNFPVKAGKLGTEIFRKKEVIPW